MKEIVRCFVFLILFFPTYGFGQLVFYAFSVGQANFIVGVSEENKRALIVDAGCHETYETNLIALPRLLNGKEVTIVITHQHRDHYNALNDNIFSGIDPTNIFIGGNKLGTIKMAFNPPEGKLKYIGDEQLKPHTTSWKLILSQSLGPGVVVEPIIPKVWLTGSPNCRSLVLRVTHRGISTLLPGDADGTLYNHAVTTSTMATAQVVFASHHGSVRSREKLWITPETQVVIISGDGRGGDRLPLEEGIEAIKERSPNLKIPCALPHKIFFERKHEDTMFPIFTTGHGVPYYKITVTDEGGIQVSEAEKLPLFVVSPLPPDPSAAPSSSSSPPPPPFPPPSPPSFPPFPPSSFPPSSSFPSSFPAPSPSSPPAPSPPPSSQMEKEPESGGDSSGKEDN